MIFIYCENPYISLDLELENENYVTTKKDKENHGMGLKQIAHIAKKYGGTVKMDTAEGMFKISVLMNRR
jgi:sensor histidine kinase regulating citrate/malate metabolism